MIRGAGPERLPCHDHARLAYDEFAPFYDLLTAHHDHAGWTEALEGLAAEAGVVRGRVLDVGCGTGKSLLPFVERGWAGTGCDVSPSMLAVAAERLGDRADLHVADMRDLPRLGQFDLVTCLCDAANYLQDERELVATLRGLERNLAPDGVVLFDVNTLGTFRLAYSSVLVAASDDRVVVLEGTGPDDLEPNHAVTVEFSGYSRAPNGVTWTVARARHHHRHHSEPVVRRALAEAGLGWTSVRGQDMESHFEEALDELRDSKAVYLARRDPPSEERR
jgi:SAM-dependent methyltransferase